MNEAREFEGKDLEDALDQASSTLGIPSEDLHYEMLEQGRRGLLGLGVKNVRIRVKPPIDTELPADDEPQPPAKKPPRREKREPAATPAQPASETPRKKRGGARSSRRRGQRGQRGQRPAQPAREPAGEPTRSATPSAPADPETVQAVEQTVGRIIELTGLELKVAANAADGGVGIQLDGDDQKMLLSRNAELLGAIQFLLNRMSRRAWPGAGRIHVTCDGHAQPRDEQLIDMARKVAQQVAQSGKTKQLRPMNAYERRLVHLAVREFAGLSSSSDGDGALKRVRISKVRNEI